tara:strand:+ start:25912 stop:26460 length:549 start_codon:yes stop_codon:yes gene_type:complete
VKLTAELKEKIRIEYVQGFESETGERKLFNIDELAKKHDVAQTTLYRAAQTDGWKQQRQEFQQEYLTRLDAERAENLVSESKKFDNTSLSLAKLLMATVGQQLRKNQEAEQSGGKGINPSQLYSLSNAALSAQRLAKLALGEATTNVNVNANIKDNNAFREAMELLDSVAQQRRESDDSAVH